MAEQVYEIGVGIALSGNTAKLVQQLAAEFTKLDEIAGGFNKTLSSTNEAMRLLTSSSKSLAGTWRDLAASAEKFSRASRAAGTPGRGGVYGGAAEPAVGGPLARLPYQQQNRGGPYDPGPGSRNLPVPYAAPPSYSHPPGTMGRDSTFDEPGGALVPYGRETRRIPLNYKPDRLPADTRYMMRPGGEGGDGIVSGVGAGVGLKMVEDALKVSAQSDALLHRLAGQGFTPGQQKQAYDAAFQTMKGVQGSDMIGNLKVLSEIQSVLQSPAESLAVLPEIARLNVALGAVTGGKVQDQALAAMKGAEYRQAFTSRDPKTGAMTIDPAKVAAFVKSELVTTAVTGGTIDPRILLQFLRSGGASTANLSDPSFFARQLPLISALGAAGAGRAVQGLGQQVGAGKMSEAAANLWIEMGILQGGGDAKHNPYMRKSGMGQFFIDPRAFPPGVQMEATRNPDKFINDYLFPKIETYLGKILGDRYTKAPPEDRAVMEQNYATQLASRIPGGKEMAEVVRTKALIDRDQKAWDTISKLDLNKLLTMNNPVVAGQGLTAAVQGVQIAAGTPVMQQAIDGLNKFSGALNATSTWANAHAAETSLGVNTITAALVGLGAGSVLKLGAMLGPIPLLFASVAGGTIVLTAAFTKLDALLKGSFPKIFTDAPLTEIQKQHGGIDMPPWVTRMSHDITHPFGSHAPAPAGGTSNAPVMDFSPGHSNPQQPLHVHVDNMSDAATHVASGIASSMSGPNHGTMGVDSKIDAGAAWVGYP